MQIVRVRPGLFEGRIQPSSVLLFFACSEIKQERKKLRLKLSLQALIVLFGLAMFLPSTDAFFDNLIELPMNMAGYMSVARASTECEDQVLLPAANPPS